MEYMERLKKINENSEFQSLMTQEESAAMMINTYVREAKEEGALEAKKEMILKLKDKLSLKELSDLTQINLEEVEKIIKEN